MSAHPLSKKQIKNNSIRMKKEFKGKINARLSNSLTKIQKDTFKFFIKFTNKNFYQPSIPEIAMEFGVDRSTIRDRMYILERKGFISKSAETFNSERCFVVPKKYRDFK